ncbi:MAG: reverse transcriptase-like protein [Alphaproteobacteria bacterium]|nr:reverse transcriptase-like protein [Alphaproteobacteria bacterium]
MDFFTDASFNSEKKMAGIGCVCVDKANGEVSHHSSCIKVENIQLAELCALMFGVQKALLSGAKTVRIVSDSMASINILHKYINCVDGAKLSSEQKKFIKHLEQTPMQKEVLDKMIDVFINSSITFQFAHVNGHQETRESGSDAYWNKRADRASKKGRILAQTLFEQSVLRGVEQFLETNTDEQTDDWRARIQVPFIQNKKKDKIQRPKKVVHHRKENPKRTSRSEGINLRIINKVYVGRGR